MEDKKEVNYFLVDLLLEEMGEHEEQLAQKKGLVSEGEERELQQKLSSTIQKLNKVLEGERGN
jgi:hypothetical protein